MTTAVCYQYESSYVDLFGSGTASAFQNPFVMSSKMQGLTMDSEFFPLGWTASVILGFLAGYEAQSRINVIQEFAATMLANIKDIDPAFARIAKEHFWDLI